jgi:hypothetical protein
MTMRPKARTSMTFLAAAEFLPVQACRARLSDTLVRPALLLLTSP